MVKTIIILLFFLPLSLFSQVFRGQLLPENSKFVEDADVQLVQQDSKGRVWVFSSGRGRNLWLRENGIWRIVYPGDVYLDIGLAAPNRFYEDNYGNVLITTKDNLFVYKNDNTVQIVTGGTMLELRQICFIDTSLYFSNSFMGFSVFPEAGYDKATNSYNYVKAIEFIKDSVGILTPYGVVAKGKELYYVCEKGLFVYNTINKTYRIIRHPELNFFSLDDFKKVPGSGGGMCIDSNGVITILTTKDNKPAVVRIYSDDSIKTFIYPYFISQVVSDGTKDYTANLFPVNAKKDEFLLNLSFDLLYFSEKTGIMYIPRPVELSKYVWGDFFDFTIVDGDELWCGSLCGGIIRCGLKELLASKMDQPPAGVEEIKPYIAMMDIYSVYPQPGTQYVDVDYFLQTCNFSENKVKIFDTYGNEVSKFSFDVIRDKGMMRTLRLHTDGLSAGGYVVEITDGDYRATGKFLIK